MSEEIRINRFPHVQNLIKSFGKHPRPNESLLFRSLTIGDLDTPCSLPLTSLEVDALSDDAKMENTQTIKLKDVVYIFLFTHAAVLGPRSTMRDSGAEKKETKSKCAAPDS